MMKLRNFFSMIGLIALLGSCDNGIPAKLEFEQFKKLYFSAAKDEPRTIALSGKNDTSFVVGKIAYGGTTDFGQGGVTAEIAADFTLTAAYNAEHNTSFKALPEGSFTFDKTSLVIENGMSYSGTVQLFVSPEALDGEQTYMLPVTIKSVIGNIPVNEDKKTAYWIFNRIPNMEICDKTGWSVTAYSDAHTEGGGINTIIDGNYASGNYWHSMYGPNAYLPHWAIIDMKEEVTVGRIVTRRRNNGDTKTIEYYVGDEAGVNSATWKFIVQGDYPQGQSSVLDLTLDATERLTGRYLKLVVSDSYRIPFTGITEVDVYKIVFD